ncbi:MAG: tyrosine protein phosphatase [Planctomycetaceae bacterium]|nr:tyrosine protein phosphatase [Planctomycetaceae bacterium]
MFTELFWIPTSFAGRLAVAPRPRGGDWLDDEISAWGRAGVTMLVSMLTPEEARELDLEAEGAMSAEHGINFRSLPVPDRDVPASRPAFRELVEGIVRELEAGRRVAVHCRQGIGRAGLVAVGVLIASGIAPDTAVATVSAARGMSVPETPDQRRWLDEFTEDMSNTKVV